MKTHTTHHPLRAFPVAGLRRETPRRGPTVEEKAALIIAAFGLFWALLIIATTTLLSP